MFGESNVLLSGPPAKDAPKRRKHKTNIVKSNSTFVSRVVAHETLSKRLQDHKPDGPFAFANVGRAMQWLDMSSSSAVRPLRSSFADSPANGRQGEPLTKLLFSRAQPLCHDVNQLTRSSSSLDVVVGFSTGDILSYEPMSGKYARINKNVRFPREDEFGLARRRTTRLILVRASSPALPSPRFGGFQAPKIFSWRPTRMAR